MRKLLLALPLLLAACGDGRPHVRFTCYNHDGSKQLDDMVCRATATSGGTWHVYYPFENDDCSSRIYMQRTGGVCDARKASW